MVETDPCIFVVDDDKSITRSLKDLLESAGFRAETFDSAESFFSSYHSQKPGVLILDVRMPGMTGIELQKKLKNSGFELPVIFISAHNGLRIRQEALEGGAVAFLQKPFDDQALLAAIHSAIDVMS